MRRSVTLFVLIMMMASRAEAVTGEVRDGDVHHESTAEAVVHAQDPHGAHAHDGADAVNDQAPEPTKDTRAAPEDGTSSHEHGSASDHCTHVHGVAAMSSMDWCPLSLETSFDFVSTFQNSDTAFDTHFPPPRS
jgi:hypothetical protein